MLMSSAIAVTVLAIIATAAIVQATITVHLVPHSHCDVGWLKTPVQYFTGLRNDIQHASVADVYDSVIASLQQDAQRKFVAVEVAFFSMWWNQQTQDKKDIVTQLIKQGQLEFINAGWVMADEATTHYSDIIDQMTYGHNFLLREFGQYANPKVGWQIDPFGHASTHASLLARSGFNSVFFARIDYQDKNIRLQNKGMEWIWRGESSSLSAQATDILAHTLFNHYSPPPTLCFDSVHCNDDAIQDDTTLTDYNLVSRAEFLVAYAQNQALSYRTNNIMFTMGDDFDYENANAWYKNMDKLIRFINANSSYGVQLMYSTPSIYTQAVHAANASFPLRTDDIFPYADGEHAYWTGYFVSRPALKKYVRDMSGLLQSCMRLDVQVNKLLKSKTANTQGDVATLQDAMAVAQHHDAVSGTEKQQVAFDYAQRLSQGQASCATLTNQALSALASGNPQSVAFTSCPLLNVSVCPITQTLTSTSAGLVVALYNPLASPRHDFIRVPLNSYVNVQVFDSNGVQIPFQLTSTSQGYELGFAVDIPSLGFNSYFVAPTGASEEKSQVKSVEVTKTTGQDITIENAFVSLTVCGANGHLCKIVNKVQNNVSICLDQNYYFYHSSTDSGQASGAYIFRPSSAALPVSQTATTQLVLGDLWQEIRQTFAPWLSQTIRLYNNSPEIELEYTVGPIPFDDGFGKEVISRFDTNMQTSTFWTDSNAHSLQQRRINYRPSWPLQVHEPVAGNYYPLNSVIYVQDDNTHNSFGVLVDRSQGGSVLTSGSVEVMVHRRCLADDSRGVGEALNETGLDGRGLVINGKHKLVLSSGSTFSALWRVAAQNMSLPNLVSFAPLTFPSGSSSAAAAAKEYAATHALSGSGVSSDLPINIHLQTFQNRDVAPYGSHILLRLAHIFERNEDSILSNPVTIDLASLVPSDVVITSVRELSLTGNQDLSSMNRYSWNTDSKHDCVESLSPNSESTLRGTQVTISPMEIRTYAIYTA